MKRRSFLTQTCWITGGTFLAVACRPKAENSTISEASLPVLRMATSADYPPYEFIDPNTDANDIIGFDVDVATHITQQLGYQLEVVNINFDALFPALQTAQADFAMAGIHPSEERQEILDFSDIYYAANYVIMSDVKLDIREFEDLADRRIGVTMGSIEEEILQDRN